ncbi:TIGR01777 family oxidoreductase [Paenibacillus allorhizosphaerae]|uniref:Epimerase family protein n=1 Tax=Paenibacillus allorhizosphaerae TaxID=2849866 RepID=A0ABN7TGA8_9BACL|nr:TIGR01777 family oxidoreductase [Paenibacillus allorhizosphaerae]CAG7629488.1 Epimerase family protein [Paenibacillus allorhizosphaerae]
MKVAIAGGTGFVGKHLTDYYLKKKASIVLISRQKKRSDNPMIRHITWSELETNIMPLAGVDAIVNLAGESINQRWTHEAKERILKSRLDAVERVSSMIERLEKKPVLVNASGISIYGTSEKETFTEESELHVDDFLSKVVDQWEMAAEHIPDTRVVLLRVGIVLGNDGGAFPKMALPFKFGVGGRVGSGKQVLSWIHIDDICRLIDFCIENEDIEGPVNATAPHAVTNDEFGRALARAMHRPYLFPVPAFVMKLMFGELSELLLKGQRVIPLVAMNKQFPFLFPSIDLALRNLVTGNQVVRK